MRKPRSSENYLKKKKKELAISYQRRVENVAFIYSWFVPSVLETCSLNFASSRKLPNITGTQRLALIATLPAPPPNGVEENPQKDEKKERKAHYYSALIKLQSCFLLPIMPCFVSIFTLSHTGEDIPPFSSGHTRLCYQAHTHTRR